MKVTVIIKKDLFCNSLSNAWLDEATVETILLKSVDTQYPFLYGLSVLVRFFLIFFCTKFFVSLAISVVLHSIHCCPNARFCPQRTYQKCFLHYYPQNILAFRTYFAVKNRMSNNYVCSEAPHNSPNR